ncbi:MAG: ABC transporter permease [SAR324 cluster bacterium]|nr:ABC transporter permease [SAR324 cluster bacterium]MEE1576220.1 nickel transporter permease [Deltaproteobacteria bacterium]MDP6246096.1 ABC transporter permease [SAR324 cluster bacterium]MDP6465238.1 ABC transporter permease [SAR324 cluster bacterium]MDP7138404.1 ABC transporter permease [SAR324 cluster bacterium]
MLRAESRKRALQDSWTLWKRNPVTIAGTLIILSLILIAMVAPWLATHDPFDQILADRLFPPSLDYWFGTDNLGRDIYSRVIHGSRLTLMIAFVVALISGPIGLVVGVLSGYLGGMVDEVLMRLSDIFLAFPKLILAIAFAAALEPGLTNAIIAISIANWPSYARLVRAETLAVRNSDYIDAVRILGAGHLRIMIYHLTPMCLSTLIVRVSLDMGTIILIAAGLGFLGLGAQPPAPEWGLMVSDGRNYLVDQWWVSTIPGIAILVVVLGFNLVGDGLRDILDPHQRQS